MTPRALTAGLESLEITSDIVMVHASMKAFGWIAGGTETVVRALLEAVGCRGTVCAQVAWEENQWHSGDSPSISPAYRRLLLPFDPQVSEAARFEGRVAERIRTWPGARRSCNPASGIAAVGAAADWLTQSHPLRHGFGTGSPYAKLIEGHGQILVLGAPLARLSILHHAETIASTSHKRRVRYEVPIASEHGVVVGVIDDIDSTRGAFSYESVAGSRDKAFAQIAGEALRAGHGRSRQLGSASCHVFDAGSLVSVAVGWLERRFPRACA